MFALRWADPSRCAFSLTATPILAPGSVAPTDSPSVKESGNEDEDYELLEVDGSKFQAGLQSNFRKAAWHSHFLWPDKASLVSLQLVQEMALSEEVVTAMQAVWAKWIEQCGTKEIAGPGLSGWIPRSAQSPSR